jgi:hypothetical protein
MLKKLNFIGILNKNKKKVIWLKTSLFREGKRKLPALVETGMIFNQNYSIVKKIKNTLENNSNFIFNKQQLLLRQQLQDQRTQLQPQLQAQLLSLRHLQQEHKVSFLNIVK